MGHGTLPKINHANLDVRHAMVDGPDSVVGRWLQPPYAVDGWRIDVANMTGRLGAIDVAHEVARTVRRHARPRCTTTRGSSASTTTTRAATSTATAGTAR